MRVRALDQNGDWQFGKGKNDYLLNKTAVGQNIRTRLMSFLGDCFFDVGAGVDWFNFLGSKDQQGLNLALSSIILNTPYVTGLVQLSSNLTTTRHFTVMYSATTSFGLVTDTAQIPLSPNSDFLVTGAFEAIITGSNEEISV